MLGRGVVCKEIPHYYEVVLFSDDVFPVETLDDIFAMSTHEFNHGEVALDIASKWNIPATSLDAFEELFTVLAGNGFF